MSTSKSFADIYYTWTFFGPTRTASFNGKRHPFVIVEDFSWFGWVMFQDHKDDTLKKLKFFCEKVQRDERYYITFIRSDHGGEFKSKAFRKFCNEQGYSHNFSVT